MYLVGPVAAPRTHLMAAIRACGPDAWISHRSAGRLFEMLPPAGASLPVDVAVHGGDRSRPGVRVPRSETMPLEETTTVDVIPATTATRTLLDLATVLPSRNLERAYREALARGLTTTARLEALLARHRGRRGSRALRALLAPGGPPHPTRVQRVRWRQLQDNALAVVANLAAALAVGS